MFQNVLKNKVAVITGAASGIGKGLAIRCAKEGMKVVLADIEKNPLQELENTLRQYNNHVISVVTDVSKESDIQTLCHETLKAFGSIHVLFNNAGVGVGGAAWEASTEQWEWALDVNLKGVIYGVKTFVPVMSAQDEESYIVNTASIAGLTTGANMAPYIVTKHAVVSLTETMFHDLALRGSKIKAAVYCPALVQSQIVDSVRNAPLSIKAKEQNRQLSADELEFSKQMRVMVEHGITPEESAECVFQGLKEGRFYILTHPGCKSMVETRFSDFMEDRVPHLPEIPV